MRFKDGIKLILSLLVVGLLLPACSHGDAVSKRAPINGWHRGGHKNSPASYHYNQAKQIPF